MSEEITLSGDTPAPMLDVDVTRLRARKATSRIQPEIVKSFLEQFPKMEELDGRIYPKGPEAIAISVLKEAEVQDAVSAGTDAYIPEHADVEYVPRLEPRSMRRPKFIERDKFLTDAIGAQTIFGSDDRKVFYSTAYPWRCNGKVESALGSASGVMVGPRHLLTCSHIMDWRSDGSVGWLKFTPMYYNGSEPYGPAWATRVYYKHKVQGPTIDSTEAKYDYVAIVLDRTIGSATGWLGTKSYSDSWDGGAYWTHAGYPGDVTGGQRPTYQSSIALDGDFWSPDSHESMNHRGDVWPGQSGGAFWGYWDGTPYAVATQSGQNTSQNTSSGGSDLVDLVLKARAEFP